jgi:hypothetical protein
MKAKEMEKEKEKEKAMVKGMADRWVDSREYR